MVAADSTRQGDLGRYRAGRQRRRRALAPAGGPGSASSSSSSTTSASVGGPPSAPSAGRWNIDPAPRPDGAATGGSTTSGSRSSEAVGSGGAGTVDRSISWSSGRAGGG